MMSCPSLDELFRLASDHIGDSTFMQLEAHLESCENCRNALEAHVGGTPKTELALLVELACATPPAPPGYQLGRELGRGGMGVVYHATRQADGLPVALKYLGGGPNEQARWRREASAMRAVDHPGVVRLLDVHEVGPWTCLVLEYVAGGRLEDRLIGMPRPRSAAMMVETVARAIHKVHQSGLLHLDLKPANILLDSTPDTPLDIAHPRVADFGLALPWGDSEATWTAAAGPRGTPSYMAPEQLSPTRATIGPASDIYALGAILYRMLTGRPPFLANSKLETYIQLRDREPVPPRRLNPDVPRALETICLACLRKNPRRRYASALELAEDLRRFLDGHRIRQRPTPILVRSYRWARRNRTVAALSFALAASLVALVLIQADRLRAAQADRDRARQELTELGDDANAFSQLLADHHRLSYIALFGVGEVDVPAVLANLQPLRTRLRQKRRDGTINLAYLSILGELESRTGQMLVAEGRDYQQADAAFIEAEAALSEAVRRSPNLSVNRVHLVEALCVHSYVHVRLRSPALGLAVFEQAQAIGFGGADREIEPFIAQTISLHRLSLVGVLHERGEHKWALQGLEANRELLESELLQGIHERWLSLHRAVNQFGLTGTVAEMGSFIAELQSISESQPLLAGPLLQDAWLHLLSHRLYSFSTDPGQADSVDDLVTTIDELSSALGIEEEVVAQRIEHVAKTQILQNEGDTSSMIESGKRGIRFLPFARRLVEHYHGQFDCVATLDRTLFHIGASYRKVGNLEAAEQTASQFLQIARDLRTRYPDEASYAFLVAHAYEQFAKNAWQYNDVPAVATWLQRAIEVQREAVALASGEPRHRDYLLGLEQKLAELPKN